MSYICATLKLDNVLCSIFKTHFVEFSFETLSQER